MEVTGKIIHKLEPKGGTSKNGNAWRTQEYVLETLDTYPRKVHFDFFGDRVDQFNLNVGDVIKLSFDIESREYNGRWYTSIRGWKSEPATANNTTSNTNTGTTTSTTTPDFGNQYTSQPPTPDFTQSVGEATDDLPF